MVHRYDETAFPIFKVLFEPLSDDVPEILRNLACDPSEREAALVIENNADKAITALRCRWMMTDHTGVARRWLRGGDSFLNQPGKPMLDPHDRELITPSSQILESVLQLTLNPAGRGLIVGSGGRHSITNYSAAAFSIDFVLFEDGEIAGDDPDRYGAEMVLRKAAGGFVASQVRAADAEGRDATPVLNALASMPVMRDELMGRLIADFARRFMHSVSRRDDASASMHEALLRHYENLPTPPKYYRK